ncbi:MAG TPA: DUF222 domain-containing protein [Candidatus Dormibacteraeota bacterium]|nr:DUF222 domain-containing protein [Candidatus Dormibacteraeota bacterium]
MIQPEVVGDALASRLVGLQLQIDLLKLERARLAAEFDRSSYWDEAGFNSSIDWTRFNCHLTNGEAAGAIAVGERLASLGASVQAVESGEIGYAHLTAMARTAEAVGERFDEAMLLELARESSPGKFYYKCQHYRHSVDARGYAREQEQLIEERRLSLSTAEDGCLLISGVLDPVGGAALRTALERWPRSRGSTTTGCSSSALPMPWSSWRSVGGRPRSRSPARWRRCSGWLGRRVGRWSSHCPSPPTPCSAWPAMAG